MSKDNESKNPIEQRVELLSANLAKHKDERTPPFHSVILAGDAQVSEKMKLLREFKGNIELQIYVVDDGGIPHVTPIKFQKKDGNSSVVIMDSLGSGGGYANRLASLAKEQNINTLITKEGRQAAGTGCWAFSLKDGEAMRTRSNLYENLLTNYNAGTTKLYDVVLKKRLIFKLLLPLQNGIQLLNHLMLIKKN